MRMLLVLAGATLGCRTTTAPAAGSGGEPAPVVQRAPAPAPAPPPAPPPSAPLPPPPAPYPVGALGPPPCSLRATLEPTFEGDHVRLAYRLESVRSEPVHLVLRSPCPAGPVAFDGLPAGADPLHTCQAGACVSGVTTTTYDVPAHGSVPLGETTLAARGDACNPPLPFGSTLLRLRVTAEGAAGTVCDGATIHIIRDARTGALRRAALTAPRVPAAPPPARPVTRQPKPPQPEAPRKVCPACAIGCPNGIPKTGTGPDGCPVCGCEDLRSLIAPQPPSQ